MISPQAGGLLLMKQYGKWFIAGVLLLSTSCGIGGSARESYESGVKLAQAGKVKQAFKSFKKAAKQAPDSARYYFAAAQTAPDQNSAFMYTKFAWEKGLKNPVVFSMLVKLSFHVDKAKKLEYALSLFGELPDSVATDNFKAELYFSFGEYAKAYDLWNGEFEKTGKSFLCPKIAQTLVRQGKVAEAEKFLYSCKDAKKLDAEGYSMLASLLAMQYKYSDADRLFAEVAASNNYNDRLRIEQATYLIFNGRGKEAEPLLARPSGPGTAAAKAVIDNRLHTLRIYQDLVTGRKEGLDFLFENIPVDTVIKEKGKNIFTAIKAFLDKDTAAYRLLREAAAQLPPDPVTTVFTARAAMMKKKYKEAVALYSRLPGVVLWSPQIVAERAQAMVLAGNEDEALKTISFMHSKRIFSRQSLELFRNLTLKKDLIEKSEAAQKLLEQQYSNDIGLKWKGLLLAIKGEKIDSALAIARQLSSAYPKEERFELTKMTLLLLKKEYRKVLDDIGTSALPEVKTKAIEAAAWKGLGDTTKAIEAYEKAIKERNEPLLKMQLAEMYFQSGKYKKATEMYSGMIDDPAADSLFKDSLQMAVLLNNNAWTIMTSGVSDLSPALEMAKKAYALAPGNLHILDTYSAILAEAGKEKDCIALLEKNSKALAQKRLLIHLSRAWEKRGDANKAKRYLEDALQCRAEDQKLTAQLTDDEIKKEIARLSEEK